MADEPTPEKASAHTEKDQKITEDILNQMPQRERLINIWKTEIEFYERLRRENGAAVIGVRLIEGPHYHYDEITEFLIDNIRANDLFTKFNANTALIDCWGNDLNQVNKICARIRRTIPLDKARQPEFDLRFAIVMGIPFLELHYPDSLKQVLHRVLALLVQTEEKPADYIPYDHFMDLEKSPEQEERMKSYTIKRPSAEVKKTKRIWDELPDRPNLT